ncbi:MAG TPA: hypothetical protein VIS57_06540 [Xanthomonadales bacterium]
MTKTRAALTHLWPTLMVFAVLAGLILFAWYPYPFRQFEGSGKFALLLILTAGFIGPLMTWLVYTKSKRRLLIVIDLSVIVLIQLAAIAWGMLSLYQNRPYFMVYTVDRFEVLSQRDVDLAWIPDPKFLNKPFIGPILLYANMPADPAAYQKLLREVMFEGKPDLQFRPEFWSIYDTRKQLALEKSRPLDELRDARPDSTNRIDQLVSVHGGEIDQFNFVPALVRDGQFAVILEASSGEVIDMLLIDPWLN